MLRKLLFTSMVFLFGVTTAFAQNGTLTGTVTDGQSGETLPGANILIQELNRGASTNSNGVYTINNVPAGDYTVRFTFVGYQTSTKTVQITADQENELNVSLQTGSVSLDELVVTGYGGEVSRGNLTSSISQVSADDIENISTSNANALLQGKAAGVTVVQNSGTPGGGIKVRVRGSTSINASNEPLYVIDGVPVSNESNAYISVGNQGLNGLSTLNPNDIKSIEVLKDASATAIYGARGANGVVLITTKSGESGDTKIDVGYSHGVKEFNNQIDMLSGPDMVKTYIDGIYADIDEVFAPYRQAYGSELFPVVNPYQNWGDNQSRYNTIASFTSIFTNPNTGEPYTPSGFFGLPFLQYGNDPSAAPTTNWQDQVFDQGATDEFNFSAQGGDEKTQYYLSGNYFNEEGIMRNAGFERLSGRLNLDHNINEKADISSHVSYSRSTTERLENDNNIYGVLTNAILAYPTEPVQLDNGEYNPNVGVFSNPVAASEVQNDAVRTRFVGNIEADYDFTDYLTLTGTLGLDRSDLGENQYAPSFTNQGSPSGSGVSSVATDQTWLTELRLGYNQDFGPHTVDAIGVVSYQETQFERTFSTGQFYPSDQLSTINNAATTTGGSVKSTNGLESYVARANYGYDERYLVTLTGRVDASSRFSEDNRYGFFPSGSIAWRISNEDFMSDAEFIDNLKLRLSAGITGNQGIGNFEYQALYGVVNYSGTPALAPAQLPNPDLKWEQTTQYNAGVDLAMLNQRLNVTVDAYIKQTDDLLLNRPVPATTGFTNFSSNIGSIENKGIELSINTVNVQGKYFTWSSTLNLSHNSNEVTKLYNNQPFDAGFANRVKEGEPLGAFYGYVSDGIWNSQEELDQADYDPGSARPGDVKFVDINDDGVINSNDQTIIGSAQPDITGGFTNNFKYKGFELNAFLQFNYGNEIYNNSQGFYGHYGYSYNSWDRALDAWTPNNTNTNVPRSSWYDSNNNTRESDFLLYDGSYLRLKSLTLAYNFTAEQLDKIGVRNLRIYATGQNLFTITDYPGTDPEINTFDGSSTSLGTDFFVYPHARSVQFGINIGL